MLGLVRSAAERAGGEGAAAAGKLEDLGLSKL